MSAVATADARPRVGISLGDVSGIGPEVTALALAKPAVRRALVPVVFGDGPTLDGFPLFRRFPRVALEDLGRTEGPAVVEVTHLPAKHRVPGKPTREGGKAQYAYVRAAIDAMRAAIAGSYGGDYWISIGLLALFIVPALLLGLVLRRPLITFNRGLVEALESTKLM